MKVILIKDCQDGKKDTIIEVADGYGKNFLIKKGLAMPINKMTLQGQQKRQANVAKKMAQEQARALDLKAKLEKLTLEFSLKVAGDKVHGSISKKQILGRLENNNIKIDHHALEHIHINKLGTSNIIVKLGNQIKANLKVEVKADGK